MGYITENELSDKLKSVIKNYRITSGTNAYTISIPGITEYYDGLPVIVKIGTTNTGNCTLNINNLGAKTILDNTGAQIKTGGLKAGMPYLLYYNGTNLIIIGGNGVDQSVMDAIENAQNMATQANTKAESALTKITNAEAAITNNSKTILEHATSISNISNSVTNITNTVTNGVQHFVRATDPGSAAKTNDIWIDTTNNLIKYKLSNGTWKSLGASYN